MNIEEKLCQICTEKNQQAVLVQALLKHCFKIGCCNKRLLVIPFEVEKKTKMDPKTVPNQQLQTQVINSFVPTQLSCTLAFISKTV